MSLNVKLIAAGIALAGAAAAAVVLGGQKKEGGDKPAPAKKEAKKPAAGGAVKAPVVDDPNGEGSLNLTVRMKAPGLGEKFMANIVIENVAGASLNRTLVVAPGSQKGNVKDGTCTAKLGDGEEMIVAGIPNYTDFSVECVPVEVAEYSFSYDLQKGTMSDDTVVTVTATKL